MGEGQALSPWIPSIVSSVALVVITFLTGRRRQRDDRAEDCEAEVERLTKEVERLRLHNELLLSEKYWLERELRQYRNGKDSRGPH